MNRNAITFDFHDTLIHCDEWFELEIRRLPSAFLEWHARTTGAWLAPGIGASVDRLYRQLRVSIIQHGHELTAERCLATVFERAGVVVGDDEIAEGVHELMCAALPVARPVDGARELVSEIHAHGIPLGIVSSAVYHPFLVWCLDRFEMSEAFGAVTTSASSGYYKSRPEIYWETLAVLEARPAGSVHIGDSLRFDVGGASAAGMRTVWLNSAGKHPDGIVPDLDLRTLVGAGGSVISLIHKT